MSEIADKLSALPVVFGRSVVEKLMPGVISSKTLANLQWLGKGPKYFKIGRKVYYERDSFINWFVNHTGLQP